MMGSGRKRPAKVEQSERDEEEKRQAMQLR